MGNTINFSETLVIAVGGMSLVLAALILYAISLVVKLSRVIMENQWSNKTEQRLVQSPVNNSVAAMAPVQTFNESDDAEDRLVVALAASIMASEDKSGSHFIISKITRVK